MGADTSSRVDEEPTVILDEKERDVGGTSSSTERAEDITSIRVMVADDEETVVDVLRTLIGSDPSLRFVGAARDAEDAIELAVRERPDVVLLDVRMPGGGGLRAAREITRRCGSTKVVALSAHEDSDTVIGMISAGASAYVPKGDSTERILRTIHKAVNSNYEAAERKPQLDVVSPLLPRRTQQSTSVAKAILDGAITAEFEPIADLATGQIVGLDARPRVATLPHRSYDTWQADAEAADLLLDVELAAFRASLLALPMIPEDLFLEFEVTPSTAIEGRFRRAIRRPVASRIALGFSPLAPADTAALGTDPNGILAGLRGRGVRIAARDVGPGFAGLRHLSHLSPELARLDGTLVRALGQSFSSHSIVAAMVACASDVGARLIAPGAGSEEQLQELRNLGVELVQGPVVGGPIPLSELGDQPRVWEAVRVKLSSPSVDEEASQVAPSSTSTLGGGAS
ncbi:MAG: EAL domain-containing protein [Actinomycetota bacterium]|nr:EAL domain-containing protein [Actinomycetota bacterium]